MVSTTASAKAALKAIAGRWLALDEEIEAHDRELEALVSASAPDLMAARGIATATAAEMLLLVGDNPERIRSEAAFAKLVSVAAAAHCGALRRCDASAGWARRCHRGSPMLRTLIRPIV